MPEVQFVHRHGERGERTGAGGVDHAVGAAQIETVGDATGHHVAQQTREGVFLPGHVGVRDAVADLGRLRFVHAGFPQRFHPDAALQPAGHVEEKLLAGGDAQDDAGALAVHFAELIFDGVVEHLPGGDQRQHLAGVGGVHRGRLHAELDGVEIDLAQERAALAVGFVVGFGVRIVVIGQQPAGSGDLGDQVAPGQNVAPEAVGVRGAGENRADTCYSDRGELRRHTGQSSG